MLQVTCLRCRQVLELADDRAGTVVPCPFCAEDVPVPAPEAIQARPPREREPAPFTTAEHRAEMEADRHRSRTCAVCGYELSVGTMRDCPFCGLPFSDGLPPDPPGPGEAREDAGLFRAAPTPAAAPLAPEARSPQTEEAEPETPEAVRKRWLIQGAVIGGAGGAAVGAGVAASWYTQGQLILALSGALVGLWAGAFLGAALTLVFVIRDWLLTFGQNRDLPLSVVAGAAVCAIVGASGLANVAMGTFTTSGLWVGLAGSAAGILPGIAVGTAAAWLAYRVIRKGRGTNHRGTEDSEEETQRRERESEEGEPKRPAAGAGPGGGVPPA